MTNISLQSDAEPVVLLYREQEAEFSKPSTRPPRDDVEQSNPQIRIGNEGLRYFFLGVRVKEHRLGLHVVLEDDVAGHEVRRKQHPYGVSVLWGSHGVLRFYWFAVMDSGIAIHLAVR